jgi:hypothetical protein
MQPRGMPPPLPYLRTPAGIAPPTHVHMCVRAYRSYRPSNPPSSRISPATGRRWKRSRKRQAWPARSVLPLHPAMFVMHAHLSSNSVGESCELGVASPERTSQAASGNLMGPEYSRYVHAYVRTYVREFRFSQHRWNRCASRVPCGGGTAQTGCAAKRKKAPRTCTPYKAARRGPSPARRTRYVRKNVHM